MSKPKVSWKGIPANERKGVAVIRNFTLAAGKKDTPQKIWREVRAHRAAQAKKQAEEAKANAEQAVQEAIAKRQCAKNIIDGSMARMAEARDILGYAEEGEDLGLPEGSLVYFVRAGMVEAMKQMEDALVDLELIDRDAEFFVERPHRQEATNA